MKIRRNWRSEDGAELVEFAVVLPLLLFVILGIAEFGFIFQRYEVLTNAAREGARMAVLPGYTEADVDARVIAYATQGRVPGLTAANIAVTDQTITLATGPAIACKRVTVTFTHNYLFIPAMETFFGGTFGTVVLTAVSEMRVENPGS
jgi:Flp pilus assembly protein TadG